MHTPFDTGTLESIIVGTRLNAVSNGLDPDEIEYVIRKAIRLARETALLRARLHRAND